MRADIWIRADGERRGAKCPSQMPHRKRIKYLRKCFRRALRYSARTYLRHTWDLMGTSNDLYGKKYLSFTGEILPRFNALAQPRAIPRKRTMSSERHLCGRGVFLADERSSRVPSRAYTIY